MNYNNPQTKRTVRNVYIVCGSLYCLFSLFFLWKLEGGFISLSQHLLSDGKTQYDPFLGALVLTGLSLIIQLLISRFFQFKKELYAFSFLPSFLLLMWLTNTAAAVYLKTSLLAPLGWFVGGIVSCLFLIWLFNRLSLNIDGKIQGLFVRLLIPNVFMLLLFSFITCVCAPNDKRLYYQFKMDALLQRHQYAEALLVGNKCRDTNADITAMRAFALAQNGTLADSLFLFPMPYHSKALLLQRGDSATHLFSPDTLFYYLGAYPRYEGQPATEFLKMLSQSKQAKPMAKDYYLCGLLLDKNLDEFTQVLGRYYALNDSCELPRYYQEALVLSRHRKIGNVSYRNLVQEENYKAYRLCEAQVRDADLQRKLVSREFGDTYWWYYDYAK